jgi:muconolactone delta-isomerase
MTIKHSPESCPSHNEKSKKAYLDLHAKMGQLTKKHGVKLVGAWATGEHWEVFVYDAPSLEALTKLLMEPESMRMAAFVTPEITPLLPYDQFIKAIK